MPMDPELAAVVELANSVPQTALSRDAVGDLRTVSSAAAAAYGAGPEVRTVENRTIPGPRGPIPVRIYQPRTQPTGVLVFLHGSGFVIYDLDSHDAPCRQLAEGAEITVVSVDYALAPEHEFPAAVDDCIAATRWVAEHREELGVANLPIAVGGDSAGGNLAAVVAAALRGDVTSPIRCQLLVYPVTDLAHRSPSYDENGVGYLLSRTMMEFFIECYTPNVRDRTDPLASPLLSDDFSGLPRTLVLTAEFDPLRDEGEAYAHALERAGVDVTLVRYDGAVHGFWQMSGFSALGRQAVDRSVEFLRGSLAAESRGASA